MGNQLDPASFSTQYGVRLLTESDIEWVFALYSTNPQYFRHCGVPATREGVLRDLTLYPPGKASEDKYFLGFFDGDKERLTAALDLILDYPDEGTAYIGFFMVDGTRAGQGLGTALMEELFTSLKAAGFDAVRLAYEKSNPQAARFWQKNGFFPQGEAAHEYGRMVVAHRAL